MGPTKTNNPNKHHTHKQPHATLTHTIAYNNIRTTNQTHKHKRETTTQHNNTIKRHKTQARTQTNNKATNKHTHTKEIQQKHHKHTIYNKGNHKT